MIRETIVMSIELVGGTTLVLTIGALTAAASRLRTWIARRNPQGLRPVQEAAQPIAQMRAHLDPYRDAAGDSLLAESLGVSRDELSQARRQAHAHIVSHIINEHLVATAAPRAANNTAPDRDADDTTLEQRGDETVFLAFLAESLRITLADLQQARESALELALTRAVEEGAMTEAQIEDRLMRYRAQSYLDPNALLAESLDCTLEELPDRSVNAWLHHRHLTWRALTARLAAARQDALAQALADGVLNPSEVECLLRESTWTPFINSQVLQVPTETFPAYGFLSLRGANNWLN